MKIKIPHFSSTHTCDNTKIFIKECYSSAKKGMHEGSLIVNNDKDDGISRRNTSFDNVEFFILQETFKLECRKR